MQDTLNITGAGYEYDFIWLYTGYSILVQWKDTTQVYNSGVTDRDTRVLTSPWQAKCKNWATILLLFRYSVFFWFSVCCFCVFRKFFGLLFSCDFGFYYIEIHIRIHFHVWIFFWMLVRGPLRWPVGLFQLHFPPWLKPLATQLVYNLIFLNKFFTMLLNPHWMLTIKVDSANVACTAARLPRQMLTTKLFTMHFAMDGFRKLLVVWRWISLT